MASVFQSFSWQLVELPAGWFPITYTQRHFCFLPKVKP